MLTVYGIETSSSSLKLNFSSVATVLTVYGIETNMAICAYTKYDNKIGLQQCLPFTVLKLIQNTSDELSYFAVLQQCLPFTVLKLHGFLSIMHIRCKHVATVLTVYGIETVPWQTLYKTHLL